jgi:hypothetical protein
MGRKKKKKKKETKIDTTWRSPTAIRFAIFERAGVRFVCADCVSVCACAYQAECISGVGQDFGPCEYRDMRKMLSVWRMWTHAKRYTGTYCASFYQGDDSA